MGAETFTSYIRNDAGLNTPQKAFRAAVENACWEYGHSGYTGTIAEKSEFVTVGSVVTVEEAYKLANRLINEGDPRVDDKWGPAGCISIAGKGFLFFGWASS
jgi:hypothetical protein